MKIDRDPTLMDMLLTLSAMPRSDRAFVLAELGEGASKRLMPLLQDLDRASFSATLKALSDEASGGAVPADMTTLGAASLRKAAEAASRATTAVELPRSDGPNSWIDRIARIMVGGR